MVREFKLVNEKGQEYSLMNINDYCLLTEPTGLGYSYSTEYERLGNTFIANLRKVEQGQINGIVNPSKFQVYFYDIKYFIKINVIKSIELSWSV